MLEGQALCQICTRRTLFLQQPPPPEPPYDHSPEHYPEHHPHLLNTAYDDGHGAHLVEMHPEFDDIESPVSPNGVPTARQPTDNAVRAIVQAMHKLTANTRAQEEGCHFLKDVAREDPGGQERVMKLGGSMVTIQAMVSHPGDLIVQAEGADALRWIVGSSEQHQMQATREGGVDALLQAIRRHKNSPEVADKAVWAVWQLSNCEESRRRISSGTGLSMLEEVMVRHASFASIQEGACMALGNLAFDDDTRADLANGSFIKAILGAMRAHPGDCGVQEAAIFAISNIACSSEHAHQITALGGYELIRTAMQQHESVGHNEEAQATLDLLADGS